MLCNNESELGYSTVVGLPKPNVAYRHSQFIGHTVIHKVQDSHKIQVLVTEQKIIGQQYTIQVLISAHNNECFNYQPLHKSGHY